MGKQQPVFIYREYPKCIYLNDEKTVWKTAHNKEEEAEILGGNIKAPKVDSVTEKIKDTPVNVDASIEINEVPQKKKPGRPKGS